MNDPHALYVRRSAPGGRARTHAADPLPVVRRRAARSSSPTAATRRYDGPRSTRRRTNGSATSISATIRWGRTTNGGRTARAAGNGSWFAATRARTRSSAAPSRASPRRRRRDDADAGACRIGGIVDRTRSLQFEFDGTTYEGFAGDTLAAALLANGVHLVGRSFKYHRPRGILCAGVRRAECAGPARATARAANRMSARPRRSSTPASWAASQNRWPSLSLRCRRDQRPRLAAHSRGLLLQDVHVAADAEMVAALRAPDPARRRHGASGAPARSRFLRAPVRALRRARDRRGSGGARRCTLGRSRRRARDAVRRKPGTRRRSRRRRRDDRRGRRRRVDRRERRASSRRTPMSRCCREPRRSATTTAISSA